MTTLHVLLSDEANDFLKTQAAKLGLATSGEFLERLVAQAMEREEQQRLEAQLLEGLNSGPGITADDEYWERKQKDLIDRARQSAGGGRG